MSLADEFKVMTLTAKSNETTPKKRRNPDAQLPVFWVNGAPLEVSSLSYQFGEFILETARGCVLKAGAEIKLRPKVYETLKYLVEHPGRLIGKQELMQAVWPDAFVTDDSLVQCTLELRRALNDRQSTIAKNGASARIPFHCRGDPAPTTPGPLLATDPFDLSDGRRAVLGEGCQRSATICQFRVLRSSDENNK